MRQGRKAGGDLGALRTLARDITGSAAARDQQQGIDHDGLAGAGLAGQGGEAAAEFEFRMIDENQVPQLKMRQHGHAPRRRSVRCERRGPSAAWSAAADSSHIPAGAAG